MKFTRNCFLVSCYFYSATKIVGNTSQNFKLLFFKINLPFVRWNQISPYRKQNLPLTSSIYLVFLPLKMQARLQQTKLYHTFFYFCLKRNDPQTLKVAAAKILFACVHVGTHSFDECFVFCVVSGRHYFS